MPALGAFIFAGRTVTRQQDCKWPAAQLAHRLAYWKAHWTVGRQATRYGGQHRCCWIDGQGTDPNEQNTQQSPCFGRNSA